jgi:hypothetical protein
MESIFVNYIKYLPDMLRIIRMCVMIYRCSELTEPACPIPICSRGIHRHLSFQDVGRARGESFGRRRRPGGDRRADGRSFEPPRFGRRDRGPRGPDGKTESPGNGAATA